MEQTKPGRARITHDDALAQLKAQGVPNPNHFAFACPICRTVQSMFTLVKAGAEPATVERYIAVSCEGRFSNAGPWVGEQDDSAQALKRRTVRGCDWTLGGLFQLHNLEIVYPDGKVRPSFEIATPEQAQRLFAEFGGQA